MRFKLSISLYFEVRLLQRRFFFEIFLHFDDRLSNIFSLQHIYEGIERMFKSFGNGLPVRNTSIIDPF